MECDRRLVREALISSKGSFMLMVGEHIYIKVVLGKDNCESVVYRAYLGLVGDDL